MRSKLPPLPKALVFMFVLLLAFPALARDKKKHPDRAMIEKMEAVPCGAKERGITGLGSIFGSAGIEHVNSDEKLCPQYMLKSDDMEYHVRPLDHKHPILLPVGQEAEFKISKDVLRLRVPDGDRKQRNYQVVSMKPVDHGEAAPEETRYPTQHNYNNKPLADKNYADKSIPTSPDGTVRPPN